MRDLSKRLEKLESAKRHRRYPYVIRVSHPPTDDELAQIAANNRAGAPYAIMPHGASCGKEWMERVASKHYGDFT